MNIIVGVFNIFNSAFFERVLNKHTPKGLFHLFLGIGLYYIGFSEDFIEIAMNYNWTIAIELITKYKYFLLSFSLVFIMVSGFLIFKREHEIIRLKNMENKVKYLDFQIEICKKERELEQLQCKKK